MTSRLAPRPGALVAVAVGGALGGVARYALDQALPQRAGEVPWGTFAANIGAALVLGWLLVLALDVWPVHRHLQPFAAIGFLGSLSTFSTWLAEVHQLLSAGAAATGVAYLLGSLLAGLLATGVGLLLGRATVNVTRGRGSPR